MRPTHHAPGMPAPAGARQGAQDDGLLQKTLRAFSVLTMLMTVPQVVAVWVEREVSGVSLWSWATYLLAACLWFVHGWRQRDKTIYLACIGWIALDAAIVAGLLMRR